jgi:hypothetical protein
MDLRNVEGCVITLVCPKIAKSIVPVLCGSVDLVGHLEVHEKTGKRWIRMRPNGEYLCKSQFKGVGGPSDQSGELPDLMELINKVKSYKYGGKNGN